MCGQFISIYVSQMIISYDLISLFLTQRRQSISILRQMYEPTLLEERYSTYTADHNSSTHKHSLLIHISNSSPYNQKPSISLNSIQKTIPKTLKYILIIQHIYFFTTSSLHRISVKVLTAVSSSSSIILPLLPHAPHSSNGIFNVAQLITLPRNA